MSQPLSPALDLKGPRASPPSGCHSRWLTWYYMIAALPSLKA